MPYDGQLQLGIVADDPEASARTILGALPLSKVCVQCAAEHTSDLSHVTVFWGFFQLDRCAKTFKEMYESQELVDVQIKTPAWGGPETATVGNGLWAHKVVLSAVSPGTLLLAFGGGNTCGLRSGEGQA
eukprot:2810102-Rhodomonas_salina.1